MRAPTEPFTHDQLADLGLTRAALHRLVAEGAVRRVFRGVYCPVTRPDGPATRAMCASLVLPEHAVVCDRSAALIHGIDHVDLAEKSHGSPPLEVVALRGHTGSVRQDMYGGVRDLLPEDVMTINGVKVTTPIRTALDLACLRGRHSALAVLDAFMRVHGIAREDFQRTLRRFKRRRGVVQLRQLVPLAIATSESTGESYTRLVIHDAGLPAPTAQVWVTLPGIGRYRLDLAYPALKIAVEYDGEEFHSAEHAEHDLARRQALRDHGWLVIVVRKHDLSASGSRWWIEQLHETLDQRVPVFRRTYPRGQKWTS